MKNSMSEIQNRIDTGKLEINDFKYQVKVLPQKTSRKNKEKEKFNSSSDFGNINRSTSICIF